MSTPLPSSQLPAVYRQASAIARLAWIRQFGNVQLVHRDCQDFVLVHFHSDGPSCKCCGKPIPRQEWVKFILGDYLNEIKELVSTDDPLCEGASGSGA